jgi:uncharacterized protein
MNAVCFQPLASGDSEVLLLAERAVYWPSRCTLLVADLHLGKAQTFWAAGAAVPDVLEADLARLEQLIRRTEAQRLIVLGDLLHASIGVTDALVQRLAQWRAGSSPGSAMAQLEIIITPGNHDRALAQVAAPWGLTVADPVVVDGPFAFGHDPVETPGCYTWAGHIHPMVRLASRGDSLRLPCFWLSPRTGVLPAFSAFTRGQTICPGEHDSVFAIADGRVVQV